MCTNAIFRSTHHARKWRVAKRISQISPNQDQSARARTGAAPLCFSRVRFLTFLRSSSCATASVVERVYTNQPLLCPRVMRPTTPRPVFRMSDQFALHGISMHVVEFLLELLAAPHVEIVGTGVARTPERLRLPNRASAAIGPPDLGAVFSSERE